MLFLSSKMGRRWTQGTIGRSVGSIKVASVTLVRIVLVFTFVPSSHEENNFQILSEVKHKELLQSLNKVVKKNVKNRKPAAQKSRRKRPKKRSKHRKKGNSKDILQNKSPGQQEEAGCDFSERSSSRPASENAESHVWFGDDDDEWNEFLKTQQDVIKKKWFNSPPAKSDDRGASLLQPLTRTSPFAQPSMSSGMSQPTPTVTTIPPSSPQVSSSQPGIPAGLLPPTSNPSAPQPQPAISPVSTSGPINAQVKPSNLPIQSP
ncbi:uncharacterized protein [Phyllobates terribilis]|uniref:uncharacterized protein n=1 Tax=Phyllobates terribilis TaxID=111132 RepID=UPI003CCB7104